MENEMSYEIQIVTLDGDICDVLNRAQEIAAEADAEIERLRAALAWQPIETAPKDGRDILLFVDQGKSAGPTAAFWFEPWGIWHAQCHRGTVSDADAMNDDTFGIWPGLATHWMPLPPAPDAPA
jgi:hypothetical protein